ncbi:MAG: hypothetical protein ACE5E6_05340, partial [Phycisphaerae bacterium]
MTRCAGSAVRTRAGCGAGPAIWVWVAVAVVGMGVRMAAGAPDVRADAHVKVDVTQSAVTGERVLGDPKGGPDQPRGVMAPPAAPGDNAAPPAAPGDDTAPEGPQLVSVLVHLAPGIDRAPIRNFATSRGGVVQYEYKLLPNLINIRHIAPEDVEALRNLPDVVAVEADVYHPNVVRLDEATPLIRGLQSQITAAGLSA